MTKQYDVSLPMTGVMYIQVEADSEEEAIEKALASDELTLDKIESWCAHEQICQGSILYAELNDAEAELAFGEEEE